MSVLFVLVTAHCLPPVSDSDTADNVFNKSL